MDIGDENKEKKETSKFGKVIEALHNKSKLPSLRTFQGDMAEFIKDKDESVISIVVKEKEKQKREEMEREKESISSETKKGETKKVASSIMFPKPVERPEQKSNGLQINFTIIVLSLLLMLGGVTASFYIVEALRKPALSEVVLKQDIIPYNNLVTLANVTKSNFGSELAGLKLGNGVSVLQISGVGGNLFKKSEDLFDFLEVSLPATLDRTLKDEYVVGVIAQNKKSSPFIILKVNDFGRAFSAMLDWEERMATDLAFLSQKVEIPVTIGSSVWKDIIIKNKDTRGLVGADNQSQIAYTFLDKNTILIVGDLVVIGEISSVYASRSVVR